LSQQLLVGVLISGTMASIQQLEKLYQIEKIFHVENSLEAAVAGKLITLKSALEVDS
jgi:hypothetical protein